MKIYAIHDRMIAYFMQPFIGNDDKQVAASIAETINGEGLHAIQQAPHHFELWRLGSIDEEGNVTKDKEYICSCDSLVREPSRLGRGPQPGDPGYRGPAPIRAPGYGGRRPVAEAQGKTDPAPEAAGEAATGGPGAHRAPTPRAEGIPGHSER